jgi:hypothetical protein
MKLNPLSKDEEALSFFSGDRSLVSAMVQNITISNENETLIVDITVHLLYSKLDKDFVIRLVDVVEYSFYHSKDHYFYNIANLKFFKEDVFFYISLDPDETCEGRANNDNDFVLSKSIELYPV